MLSDRGGDGGEEEAGHPWRRRGNLMILVRKEETDTWKRRGSLFLEAKLFFSRGFIFSSVDFCAL
jgi:hypothetical protein